jgi:hypothetical protein
VEKMKQLLATFIGLLLLATTFTSYASDGLSLIKIDQNAKKYFGNDLDELNVFLSLEFEVNHQKIKATDAKTVKVRPYQEGFDTVFFSFFYQDSIHRGMFICKLKGNETYTISPCTCCGLFAIAPSKNAMRGDIKFVNNSSRDFIAETGDEYLTIEPNKETSFIHSFISMNCGFRPTKLFISDPSYVDSKFLFENLKSKSEAEQDDLEKEREGLILFSFNFLFLHQEKLVVTIDATGEHFDIKL